MVSQESSIYLSLKQTTAIADGPRTATEMGTANKILAVGAEVGQYTCQKATWVTP